MSDSKTWRPEIHGWSDDVLPFYERIAMSLPNPCRVVEVGVAKGRSAIYLAEQLANARPAHGASEVWLIDPWGGGWFRECIPSIVKHSQPGELELLRPVRATSKQAARMFDDESLDLVFIDGDHSRQAVAEDMRLWWPKLKVGGIFSGHDYDRGVPAHIGVCEAVDEFFVEADASAQVAGTVWFHRKGPNTCTRCGR